MEYNSGSICASGSKIVSGSVVVTGNSLLYISGSTGVYSRIDTQPYTITLFQEKDN